MEEVSPTRVAIQHGPISVEIEGEFSLDEGKKVAAKLFFEAASLQLDPGSAVGFQAERRGEYDLTGAEAKAVGTGFLIGGEK